MSTHVCFHQASSSSKSTNPANLIQIQGKKHDKSK